MNGDFPPRSFPDPPAIDYALAYARGTKNVEAEKHLLRLQARSNAFCNGYGTHIPLLASVVATAPPGDVLELGVGHFSSPLLSAMCKAMGRHLTSFEEKAEWLDNVRDLEAPHHDLRVAADPFNWMPDVDALFGTEGHFAVIFIDHGRTNQDRMAYLRQLADRADFIVCHDTRNTWFAGVDEVLDSFKHRFDYCLMTPVTTVVSNKYDVSAFEVQ
jgi:predicted O-methyltransferase YrrM